jgi:hypothetical protein
MTSGGTWALAPRCCAGYTPLINGSDSDFSDPQALTEPGWPMR